MKRAASEWRMPPAVAAHNALLKAVRNSRNASALAVLARSGGATAAGGGAGVAVGGEGSTAGASDLRAKTKKTKTKILACEQVLSDMAVAGLKPDAVSFNTMLQVR